MLSAVIRTQPQFLYEYVCCGGHQHAELVSPEVCATGAANLHSVVQFLNAILEVPALTVDDYPAGVSIEIEVARAFDNVAFMLDSIGEGTPRADAT